MPKGYLRVLSFNEDSVLVDQRTVQLTDSALNNYQTLRSGQLIVQQNGYVSVYVGNESAADVYFDDVTIEHRQGLQVQENQYDPFGLDLAGVSGAAPGLRLKNYYQFNGKENQLDLGLNWNHQDWRFYDYQIGRWHAVDPEIENAQESWTPYSFGFDNAVRYADANGRAPGDGAPPATVSAAPFYAFWPGAGNPVVRGVVGFAYDVVAAPFVAVANAGVSLAHGDPFPAVNLINPASLGIGLVTGIAQGVGTYLNPGTSGKQRVEMATKVALAVALGVAAKGNPCGCFAAGTAVSMRLGRKSIEQVQVGDSVWAYNERTHQTALRPVTQLFRYQRDTVYVLHTATGEALRTTSDHPFYVRGQWVRVKRLRVGDSLVSQSGQRHVLRRIDLKPEHVTVYNFTVDELHTYFVGQNAILVHNVSCPPVGQKLLPQKAGPTAEITTGEVTGKTPAQIDARAKQLGLQPKGSDPMNGKGSYIDPSTGKQRMLSHPNASPPHGHVNNAAGQRTNPAGQVVPKDAPDAHLPIR